MGIWEKLLSNRLQFSGILLTEASSHLVAEPQVWARQVGQAVTFGKIMGEMAKRQIPTVGAALPIDLVVFHELPMALGLVHAVQFFSGPTLLPTDFLLELDVSIPRAAWVKKGTLISKWATVPTEQGQRDEFREHLDGLERGTGKSENILDYANKWSFSLGRVSGKMPFTMQIIPLGTGTCVYVFKRQFQPGLWSAKQMRFHVDEFLTLASWLRDGLADYRYDGPPAPVEVPVPSYSLIAIAGLADLFTNKGQPVDWPVVKPVVPSVAPIAPSPASATLAPATGVPSPKARFCVFCGSKLPAFGEFCPSCGKRQTTTT